MNKSPPMEITPQSAAELMDELSAIASRASAAILAIPIDQLGERIKSDQSPVTKADEASEAIILEGLARILPRVPIIAEESAPQAPGRIDGSCLIVDPLDGTKEFLAGRDEYTVNIGLVTQGVPIAGVISAPKQGLLWRGVANHGAERLRMNFPEMPAQASERIQIQTRTAPNELTAAISRTHLDPKSEQFLSHFRLAKRYGCGSSLKFCQIAQGDADIYPRLAQTCEWDIAAGAAILAAAGGRVTNPRGGDLRFAAGGDKFLVPGFVAWGDPAIVRKG